MNGSSLLLTAGTLALTAGLAAADAPRSASLLEFGPDNTLFIADQLSGAIHAFTLSQSGEPPEQDAAFNLLDLDLLVSDGLGATGRLVYGDLAVHPVTRDAYVSVTGMVDGVETVAVVSIGRDGNDSNFNNIPQTIAVGATSHDGFVSWYSTPGANLLISA
ncbi:MAG: hypothetical protein AAFU56_09080, partial [Pseudomonadota bacterium]